MLSFEITPVRLSICDALQLGINKGHFSRINLHHVVGRGPGPDVKKQHGNCFYPGVIALLGMKNCGFLRVPPFISDTIQDMAIVTMEDE